MRASLDHLICSVGFRAQAFPSAESFLYEPFREEELFEGVDSVLRPKGG